MSPRKLESAISQSLTRETDPLKLWTPEFAHLLAMGKLQILSKKTQDIKEKIIIWKLEKKDNRQNKYTEWDQQQCGDEKVKRQELDQ